MTSNDWATLSASTLHRLLGWLPSSRSRFRHDASNPLPHDVVIVDEMSMVSLTMMARLLEAVRPSARLVLVGDPDQLSSVEAGAVLADIARAPGVPEADLGRQLVDLGLIAAWRDSARARRRAADAYLAVRRSINELAKAIRAADPDAAIAVLRAEANDVQFREVDLESDPTAASSGLLADMAAAGSPAGVDMLRSRQRTGDIPGALAALDRHRLLCAHRRGPYGVLRWGFEVERWLAESIPGYGEEGEWYVGRPLLVTANDYEMSLYNGDTGVIVETPAGVRAAFARGAGARLYPPVRLDAVQTVHAMTVHRAQGSQFDTVSFVVPPPDSPLLTRELLYTAVTRARRQVNLIGSEDAIRRAVLRPANRASGLRNRLAPAGELGGSKRRLAIPPCLNHPGRDRALARQSELAGIQLRRELVAGVPLGVADLLDIDIDVGPERSTEERHHERAGKRPWLAAEVVQVGQTDVDLFADFAVDGLLQRLAGFHESGQHGNPISPLLLATEQQPVRGVQHRDDHRSISTREVIDTAALAVSGHAAIDHDRRAPAARASRLQPMPVQQRCRSRGNIALIVRELKAHLTEIMHFALG